jgi:integrase/recombinase XerD
MSPILNRSLNRSLKAIPQTKRIHHPMSSSEDIVIVPTTEEQKALEIPEITVADVWDMALTGVLSDNSRRAYKQAMVNFASFLLSKIGRNVPDEKIEILKTATPFLPSVRFQHVAEYREALRVKGLSNATINLRLAAIHTMFKRMRRLGMIDQNPADPELVQRMRVSNISTTEGLSSGEAEKLLRICHEEGTLSGQRDLALFAVMMHNGLRRSEAIQLDVGNFRMVEDTPTYTLVLKGGKVHTIEFIGPVWTAIQRWLDAGCIQTGPVFSRIHKTKKGKETVLEKRLTASGVYNIIRNRCHDAGIEKNIHPHSMRHTYATLALLAGVPIQEVQISMGHANTDTTFRYYRAVEQVGRSPARSIQLEWPDGYEEKQ